MEIGWDLITSGIATIGSLFMVTTKKLERRVIAGIWLIFAAFVIQATVVCYNAWGISGITWLVVFAIIGATVGVLRYRNK